MAVIGVGVALILGWVLLGASGDERMIQKRLIELTKLVEKEGSVSQFEALGRSRKFKELFVASALIEYLPGRSLPRQTGAMQSGFLSIWGQIETASIRVSDHEVDVDERGAEATSDFVATCQIIINGSDRMGDAVRYRAYWIKQEGDWLIERIVAERTG